MGSKTDKQVKTVIFIELVALVLKNTNFEFFEKTYKQIFGRAIGTKFVSSYAILSMAG